MSHSNFISQINRFPVSQNGPEPTCGQSDAARLQRLIDGVIENSPYLSRLLEKHPEQVRKLLETGPAKALLDIYPPKCTPDTTSTEEFEHLLRTAKSRFHLCLALIDLSGVWDTQRVTKALSDFADYMVENCTEYAWQNAQIGSAKPTGFFVVAFGKLGGHELNYSSDIDLAFFYDAQEDGPSARDLIRMSRQISSLLSKNTPDGYVFRTDIRLRPDPASTPIALSTDAALGYYESVGQTWERAAWIKARIVAGDMQAGTALLARMRPFVWRKNLDFAAIEDIHLIRQQMFTTSHQPVSPEPGFNVKLGAGGIREIELFVQTLQLIHGGRQPELRGRSTLAVLKKLVDAGLISAKVCADLCEQYVFLRQVEHALQMVDDQQTHTIPDETNPQNGFARLLGYQDMARFQTDLIACTNAVSEIGQTLFGAPRSGQLALDISGFENNPNTLAWLTDAGFADADGVLTRVRGWMVGHIAATRSERARRLLAGLAGQLFCAFRDSGEPDAAFAGFARFFEALPLGVQILSLFANSPDLLLRLVDILMLAPKLADTLSKRPHMIEALLVDFENSDNRQEYQQKIADADDLELAMNVARRFVQDELFRIGANLLTGHANPDKIASDCTSLVDATIDGLAKRVDAALRTGSGAATDWLVLGMGKLGSKQMMPGSDLDIVILYQKKPDKPSTTKTLPPETWAARFTRRLILALSAPTSEGELYEVDMALRPSGSAGPIAVGVEAFTSYYLQDAWTWELQALTRARVICSSSAKLQDEVETAIQSILRRPREKKLLQSDIADMRARLLQEKPASGLWDIKAGRGGLVELEFIVQANQLMTNKPLSESAILSSKQLAQLVFAERFFHQLLQITKMAVGQIATASELPPRLQGLLVQASGLSSIQAVESKIKHCRQQIGTVLDEVLG